MTTREITGTVVGVRTHREDATRMYGALLGAHVQTLTMQCEGAALPALAQHFDPGSLRAARLLRVRDCRVNGASAWIVSVEGDVAEVLAPPSALKSGDAVILACDLDAQPRVLPVGAR